MGKQKNEVFLLKKGKTDVRLDYAQHVRYALLLIENALGDVVIDDRDVVLDVKSGNSLSETVSKTKHTMTFATVQI